MLAKIKRVQEKKLDIAEYLEEEEIPILLENTPTLQKKAFWHVYMNLEADLRNFYV